MDFRTPCVHTHALKELRTQARVDGGLARVIPSLSRLQGCRELLKPRPLNRIRTPGYENDASFLSRSQFHLFLPFFFLLSFQFLRVFPFSTNFTAPSHGYRGLIKLRTIGRDTSGTVAPRCAPRRIKKEPRCKSMR